PPAPVDRPAVRVPPADRARHVVAGPDASRLRRPAAGLVRADRGLPSPGAAAGPGAAALGSSDRAMGFLGTRRPNRQAASDRHGEPRLIALAGWLGAPRHWPRPAGSRLDRAGGRRAPVRAVRA